MENNTTFKITYYSNKDKKHITRQGKWTDKCRYWTSKAGDKLMTYFDMEVIDRNKDINMQRNKIKFLEDRIATLEKSVGSLNKLIAEIWKHLEGDSNAK